MGWDSRLIGILTISLFFPSLIFYFILNHFYILVFLDIFYRVILVGLPPSSYYYLVLVLGF